LKQHFTNLIVNTSDRKSVLGGRGGNNGELFAVKSAAKYSRMAFILNGMCWGQSYQIQAGRKLLSLRNQRGKNGRVPRIIESIIGHSTSIPSNACWTPINALSDLDETQLEPAIVNHFYGQYDQNFDAVPGALILFFWFFLFVQLLYTSHAKLK
jgi:hypothetical protein